MLLPNAGRGVFRPIRTIHTGRTASGALLLHLADNMFKLLNFCFSLNWTSLQNALGYQLCELVIGHPQDLRANVAVMLSQAGSSPFRLSRGEG